MTCNRNDQQDLKRDTSSRQNKKQKKLDRKPNSNATIQPEQRKYSNPPRAQAIEQFQTRFPQEIPQKIQKTAIPRRHEIPQRQHKFQSTIQPKATKKQQQILEK